MNIHKYIYAYTCTHTLMLVHTASTNIDYT